MTTLMTDPAAETPLPAATLPAANRPAATLPAQRIVLTGFMGAGKSTVGRLLATQLGWDFIDIDSHVEALTGMTVAEIFATEGEAAFRRRETSAIAKSLGRRNVVIALGGGAPEIPANRILLEQTRSTAVVFLDAPFEVLFDRCVLQEGAAIRPVLMNPEEAADRFRRRTPHYRRCAQHHIVTADHQPQDTAAAVLRQLGANASTI